MIPKCKQLNKEIASLNKGNTYSTEETEIGTWINGKTLYRKVMNIPISTFGEGTATEGETFSLKHNISNIDLVINKKCTWFQTNNKVWRDFPSIYYGAITNWAGELLIYDQEITFELGATLINRIREFGTDMFAIIEYTKTTD